ncbi:UDP-GlcNAc:betaGal beta-1,3-N-acetylglucosaminyltransferase 9 [Corythoichthys intestinalis]|uniref:UDP-GlcNAc:betaGal beta-1,3-N-acetylglucosaminyltransferase 9 n=1 Tax=Corythoichthys intestinalis TaxID=161448 RepID=UPI0025A4F930|nr:UDP-GlcNAc:betaGal beta-1,3-N-acetylglucosaminyltransferase 9 [Corythoichthys intestinalis]XP_057692344.1 UDP-GlcNAc:betaGal beta-1,3-N-acetylglucosaminyltransferase 9 [Corythoichthys intestinalis]XP_061813255.1 UDP-GlcNAc:betaGal beta-1,3-N-acetylglucosaminyltransferase 9-like [Nerophis lumbriciformis]
MVTLRRKGCYIKGDVMCTMLLLLLFFLLLYLRQVLLSSEWDKSAWKLEIFRPTTSSRTLLGTDEARVAKESPPSPVSRSKPHLPPCEPKSKRPQPKSKVQSKSKGKTKSRQKKVTPTKTSVPLPTLPLFDFPGYLREKDKRNFQLLIDQPRKCQPEGSKGAGQSHELYMLIAVKSVAADFDKRQVVRRTWGKETKSIRTVFLLGVPKNRTALPLWNQLLTYESQTFEDILLWDFEDTFFNLTLKEIHFLEWINHTCPQVKFIFKGDADVYVNVDNIMEMLQDEKSDQDLFVGDIIVNAKPIRRRSSKYYVPEFVYGSALYPSYAGGGGFVMSGYTARRLSASCQQVELFPIDDVFLGMCLQLIGIKPSRHQGFRTFGIPRPSAAPHLQTFDPCFYRELMVVHSLSVPQIWLMWNLLHDPKLSCHNRTRPTSTAFKWKIGKSGKETETDYDEKRVFVTHD